jgi:hypothetical protein
MNTDHERTERGVQHRWISGLLGLIAAFLVACGGGDWLSAGGVGSGGTGLAEGTVTGFGSVIVDGVAYGESDAAVVSGNETGALNNADLRLGQRVRLTYTQVNGQDTATQVEVLPQLRGPVSMAANPQGQLQVMGQVVQVRSTEAQSQTVLAGMGTLLSLAVGDDVEVHGSWLLNPVTARYELVATRIEKVASGDTIRLLSGVVHSATRQSQGTFWRLNAVDGVPVLTASPPAGLEDGALVRMWLGAAALEKQPLQALRVVLADIASTTSGDTVAHIRLSAQVSGYVAGPRTLAVQGVKLNLAEGLGLDEAALGNGSYINATISRQGGQWQVVGASVQSGATALTREIELKGVVGGIDFTSNPVGFVLRGTSVQATPSVLDASCAAVGTGDVYLQVQGSLPTGSAVLQASRVQCKTQTSFAGAVVERKGTVIGVNTTQRSLVLQMGMGVGARTLTADWDANSYFPQSPDKLPGLAVEIEGIQNGNQLRIRRVRLH